MSGEPSRSRQIYERALRVLPGGASRNTVLHRPNPYYVLKGEGCYVTDIEGVRRIDFANNMASLIHGHAHPAIVEAVTKQLQVGTAFTFATEVEVDFAEHMVSRSASFDKIRFVNSGTEAVMCCLKAARAFTGRPKIAKVEGCYHGIYDFAEVSQTAKPGNWGDPENPVSVPVAHGTPSSVLDDVVVIPFNDPERAVTILDRHADELACVLVDPLPHRVCLHPASQVFVEALRRWTLENDALLAFDEVITYRCEYGGAQEWYDVQPDLTAMGKVIGGGFPVGAIAGRGAVMNVLDPFAEKVLFPHSGTFSANPITMTGGLTAMRLYDRETIARVNSLADRARQEITAAIKAADVPACVTGAGSIFRIHMKPEPPRDHRSSFLNPDESRLLKALLDYFFAHGIMLINTCSGTISTPMTGREIDALAEVAQGGFQRVKEMRMELTAVGQAG